jgi:hypothetical protein
LRDIIALLRLVGGSTIVSQPPVPIFAATGDTDEYSVWNRNGQALAGKVTTEGVLRVRLCHMCTDLTLEPWKRPLACLAINRSSRLHKKGPMTRYYFDIRDGEALYPDEEGTELEDQRAAEIEAAKSLGDMARDLSPLDDRHHMAIEVRTKTGPLFQAAFIFEAASSKH